MAYAPHRADDAFKRFVDDQRDRVRFVPLEVGRDVSPASDLRGVARLVRLIRVKGPFDVVHGHSSKGGAIARVAGRLSGVPTVYTPNSLIVSSPDLSKAERVIYASIERGLGHLATSKLIAVSEDEREFALKVKLVPGERVALIENGIDDEEFDQFSRESIREDDGKPLTFGAAMRFSAQKAPDRLVAAFIRLREELPQQPMRLVIAGDGDLFSEVERQVEASGLDGEISLLGWRTDTREVLRSLDVFVLSSLYEGFSYGVLEAMAAKLPVVSTEVFGTRQTVARVPGNVVVPVGDSSALALGMKQMTTLAAPKELRRALRRIGQANHDYARLRFRQSEITRRTLEVYRALC